MSKVIWPVIKSNAPEAYQLIQNMKFTQDQYEDLIKLFAAKNPDFSVHPKTEAFQQTACDWISHNVQVWGPWIPENLTSKRKLYLGAMIPISGPFQRLPEVLPGTFIA